LINATHHVSLHFSRDILGLWLVLIIGRSTHFQRRKKESSSLRIVASFAVLHSNAPLSCNVLAGAVHYSVRVADTCFILCVFCVQRCRKISRVFAISRFNNCVLVRIRSGGNDSDISFVSVTTEWLVLLARPCGCHQPAQCIELVGWHQRPCTSLLLSTSCAAQFLTHWTSLGRLTNLFYYAPNCHGLLALVRLDFLLRLFYFVY